jgi:hypothetical protein
LQERDSIEGNDDELKKAIKADKVRRAFIKEGIDTERKNQRAKRQRKDASNFDLKLFKLKMGTHQLR